MSDSKPRRTWEDILWDPTFDFPSYLAEATNRKSRKSKYGVYLKSVAWKRRRTAALQVAGNRCELCGATSYLQVHHRTYERVGNELPTDLLVVCDPCHDLVHKVEDIRTAEGR